MADQFPPELLAKKNYNFFINPAVRRGYSGTAILTKEVPLKYIDKIGIKKFDDEGRTQILEFEEYILINCYFPNGQRDHGRVDFKLEYYKKILSIFKKYVKAGRHVVLTGDFNTAHEEIDLANPKTNQKTTGFLPHEREWMDKYINAGMIDSLRKFHPNKEGIYSWWTYRGDCRARNVGWRIDYFMVNQGMEDKLKDCHHLTEIMGSDHCPIVLKLKKM